MLDKFFPLKSYSVKNTDDPWITDHYRKESRKCRNEYKKNGKSERYMKLKAENKEELAGLKKVFYDKECSKLTTPGSHAISFNALKKFNTPSRPSSFSVLQLYPEKSEEQALEESAEFYNRLSSEFKQLEPEEVPSTDFNRNDKVITATEILKRLNVIKHPKSMVPGDLPPKLIPRLAQSVSPALADIFNCVSMSTWPIQWRTEYQTIIPKKANPNDINDCRNLCCTNFYSKVLESFVLEQLLEEFSLSENQFGGIRGCGTNPFLLTMWQNILEGLEEDQSAVSLMSIDFSKAFNRMGHQACLSALAAKGCTNQSISTVYKFLHGRRMHVRNGQKLSKVREVSGGSPQGTKLGNLLFCVTLESLDNGERDLNDTDELEVPRNVSVAGGVQVEEEESAIPEEYQRQMNITEDLSDQLNENLRRKNNGMFDKNNVIRDTILEHSVPLQGRDLSNWTLTYIDDMNIGEVHAMEKAKSLFSQLKEKRTVHATHCESRFSEISVAAENIGMVINAQKTQLLCMSDNRFCNTESYFITNGTKISSVDNMKILGFVFDTKPNVGAHISYSINKFSKAIWALNHLKRARMDIKVLTEVYKVMLRPLLEYCAVVYHSMLTFEQTCDLERQQKRALRIIYGFGHSSEKLLELAGVETLEERRVKACEDFAAKLASSDRFASLFPLNAVPDCTANTRSRKTYQESFARTARLFNSPLYYMRRNMNEK